MSIKTNDERSTAARARAEASFKKEERAKDVAKAMMEYQANGKALREKISGKVHRFANDLVLRQLPHNARTVGHDSRRPRADVSTTHGDRANLWHCARAGHTR